MFIGLLLTALISLIIGGFGFYIFIYFRALDSARKNKSVSSFALFWLLTGVVWVLISIADIFAWYGMMAATDLVIYALQVVIAPTILVAAWHVNIRIYKSECPKCAVYIYGAVAVLFLYTLFRFGVERRASTFFSNQTLANEYTLALFLIMTLPIFISIAWHFTGNLFVARHAFYSFGFLADISFMLLAAASSIDELGLVSDWNVTFVRLVTLVSVIFAYFAVETLHKTDELVV